MKKVLILGAGIYQVPLIKRAKRRGLFTIVASVEGNYPGFEYADKVYYINTTDRDAILRLAIDEQIDGILTTGTDVAVKTIGYVCDRLNLTGISENCAENATNKAKMKCVLLDGGVRTARYHIVKSVLEAEEACRDLGFPVIFKCVDKSGSRGIKKVNCIQQIKQDFSYSLSYSDVNYIVVEKYLEGYEIGVDGYIDQTQSLFLAHTKINYSNGYTYVPIGHCFPFECDEKLYRDIVSQAEKAVQSLKMDKCFFNMDIMIANSKSYVIEVGARTGATCIPELISCYCGFDYYEKMLDCALGDKVDISYKKTTPCIAELLISETDGRIVKYNLDNIDDPRVKQVHMDYVPGDRVQKFRVGPDRIGDIVVCGESLEEAKRILAKSKKRLELVIE